MPVPDFKEGAEYSRLPKRFCSNPAVEKIRIHGPR